MSKALNLRLRREHELTTKKKEDAVLRRIVTDILQFGSVSVASALPDARPLANDLGGLARHTFLLAIVIPELQSTLHTTIVYPRRFSPFVLAIDPFASF
jgi:hypothetical protein